ncbi:MAG: hypothetical protein HKM98_00870 [Gammaproteobacteria bacterium]|nr:hypothetical protein [Gammaproteobacteria bacterium]
MDSLHRYLVLLLFFTLTGCVHVTDIALPQTPSTARQPGVVEIVAKGMQFEAPAEVPAGWNTFRFFNDSAMVHFALLEKMPPGTGLIEQQEQVAPAFQEGMDLLNAGKQEAAMKAFGKLPAWFADVEFFGGAGLVSPGNVAETTVYLEPGTYLIECYVKTGGIFHSFNPSPALYGMVAEFTVVPNDSRRAPPKADWTLSVSGVEGIRFEKPPMSGRQVVEVYFADQQVHENFVGHDVHLLRFAEDTDIASLVSWMDWRSPKGLDTPAPAEFVGGVNEMAAGSRAYLHLNLVPGRYAWIAEVPNAAGKKLLREFSIPSEQ